MIQILKGKSLIDNTRGKSSVLITEKDGPLEFSPELEARLVDEGVARYVEKVATARTDEKNVAAGDNISSDGSASNDKIKPDKPNVKNAKDAEKPVYKADMKVDELRALLKANGMQFKAGMSKADMVALLDKHFAALDDDDTPPDLSAEEPVS